MFSEDFTSKEKQFVKEFTSQKPEKYKTVPDNPLSEENVEKNASRSFHPESSRKEATEDNGLPVITAPIELQLVMENTDISSASNYSDAANLQPLSATFWMEHNSSLFYNDSVSPNEFIEEDLLQSSNDSVFTMNEQLPKFFIEHLNGQYHNESNDFDLILNWTIHSEQDPIPNRYITKRKITPTARQDRGTFNQITAPTHGSLRNRTINETNVLRPTDETLFGEEPPGKQRTDAYKYNEAKLDEHVLYNNKNITADNARKVSKNSHGSDNSSTSEKVDEESLSSEDERVPIDYDNEKAVKQLMNFSDIIEHDGVSYIRSNFLIVPIYNRSISPFLYPIGGVLTQDVKLSSASPITLQFKNHSNSDETASTSLHIKFSEVLPIDTTSPLPDSASLLNQRVPIYQEIAGSLHIDSSIDDTLNTDEVIPNLSEVDEDERYVI